MPKALQPRSDKPLWKRVEAHCCTSPRFDYYNGMYDARVVYAVALLSRTPSEASRLYRKQSGLLNLYCGWSDPDICYILERIGALPPRPSRKVRQVQQRSRRHRPIDMGGPRDVWMTYGVSADPRLDNPLPPWR
jgi:hypothetical protein